MRKLILIFMVIAGFQVFAQNTEDANTEKKDSAITITKYAGLNVGSFMEYIMDPKSNVGNFSLLYKVKKSNGLLQQYKLASYNKKEYEYLNFYDDSTRNYTVRTYEYSYNDIDFRVGFGIYDNLGYGDIYLIVNALAGYASYEKTLNDFITIYNDSTIDGYKFTSESISKAGYLIFGIDFAFGYEIDLGKHISLDLEYNPKFTFNTLVSEKYYIEDAPKYQSNIMVSNFSVFNVNLLYRF